MGDILQESRKAGRAEETLGVITDFFDLVLVHGDPAFELLEETFPLARRIADSAPERISGAVADTRCDDIVDRYSTASTRFVLPCPFEPTKTVTPDVSSSDAAW